ncbi:MAG: beta-propeller domain-containing protein [Candidatus Aenigmarchaeota archaeon]|nr:beta-propeller domain-containing protein [Candidatus Aenigmarchaeota archaeon]
MTQKKIRGGIPPVFLILALLVSMMVSFYAVQNNESAHSKISKVSSCSALVEMIDEYQKSYPNAMIIRKLGATESAQAGSRPSPEFSATNVQVEGVDEADIVKTDGEYIYAISSYYNTEKNEYMKTNKLAIAKAYPPEESSILNVIEFKDFEPIEMFVHKNTLLLFGYVYKENNNTKLPFPMRKSFVAVRLYDITDRSEPKMTREIQIEGRYVSSRKIGPYVYFVVDSYPDIVKNAKVILPEFYDSAEGKDTKALCGCSDIEYFEDTKPETFITVASLSMEDPEAKMEKRVILGSGQSIYASKENLYIAEMYFPLTILRAGPEIVQKGEEKTVVHKFSLGNGEIKFIGSFEVPGHILNQFSMDEYNGYFRIATTLGRVTIFGGNTSNNIYIYDENLKQIGDIENIAPGESIYSARFMGERAYLVTFRKTDPFFVIDLSDPKNPKILGKLKIPGYSDYLHPYDENHIIGIGKETVPAGEDDFAWYQGLKIALFDVTDVSNPKEIGKVVIGDRGTDSYALHNHKAFLFSKNKNLLVIPVLLAEIKGDKENLPPYIYGEFVYKGAYAYRVTLENGFEFLGRITHFKNKDEFLKSGHYFYGDKYSVKRSLYIDNVLYTISNGMIKMNKLYDLEEIGELNF